MKGKFCGLAVLAAIGAAGPACAWEQFVGAAPNFVHNLAPEGALSVNANGDVCLLSNDRVYGQVQFAHIFTFDANGGAARPTLSIGHPSGLTTFGVDCRFGPPVIGVRWTEYAQRNVELVSYSDDRMSTWPLDFWPIGAASVTRFGAASGQVPVVLREKPHGAAFAVEAYAPPPSPPMPVWGVNLANGAAPGLEVSDFAVAADASSVLMGVYDNPSYESEALFIQHLDAQGQNTFATSIVGDPSHPEIGPTAISPGGFAYYVRRGNPFIDDELWRIDAAGGPPQWMPVSFGTPALVLKLVTLADNGALVLSQDTYGVGFLSIARYAADGSLLWRSMPGEIQAPRTVLDLIGDRAGRVLVVSVDPAPQLPGSRLIELNGFDAQGYSAWGRSVLNARFDEGNPVALALTSDDRAVIAVHASDSYGTPGILVQSFTLDSSGP